MKDISRDGDSYVLSGKQLLKIFNSTNFNDHGSMRYLYRYIENSGGLEKLKEMGLDNGDTIKIEDFEFEYYDEGLLTGLTQTINVNEEITLAKALEKE